jgi:SAM-dependent methyltransferase
MDRILTVGSEAEFLRRGREHADIILKEAPTGKILDYGCGIGRVLRFLPRHRVEGYDSSERMRTLAMEWCGRTVLSSLEGKDDYYDAIFEILVLQHDPVGEHITIMVKCLKKGGKLISVRTFYMPIPLIPLRIERWFMQGLEVVTVYVKD